jgi:exosortase D (VPLPA-CTERM-specific)
VFGITDSLTGNVIDLGYYKLQIVEACSGLRYIYPLLSLGFLAAYFFKAPLWQRLLVFISVVPIAIVMNSIRIGLVGVAVNFWGPQAADGILHLFEGWFVFLVAAGALAFEIFLLAHIFGRPFFEVFSLPTVPTGYFSKPRSEGRIASPAVTSLLLLCAGAAAIFHISARSEIIPDRPRFVSFPEQIGSWRGRSFLLEPEMERVVRPDDYILSDYKTPDGKAVNLYAAYYASQRKNDKPHSPGECIPANGWDVASFQRTTYAINGINWPLNRAVIQKNGLRQLVYYWFHERGRTIANEYLAKWYLHADAAFMNRTDGALVRVVTQIYNAEMEHEADQRLQAFLRDTLPTLSEFLPSTVGPRIKSVRRGSTNG